MHPSTSAMTTPPPSPPPYGHSQIIYDPYGLPFLPSQFQQTRGRNPSPHLGDISLIKVKKEPSLDVIDDLALPEDMSHLIRLDEASTEEFLPSPVTPSRNAAPNSSNISLNRERFVMPRPPLHPDASQGGQGVDTVPHPIPQEVQSLVDAYTHGSPVLCIASNECVNTCLGVGLTKEVAWAFMGFHIVVGVEVSHPPSCDVDVERSPTWFDRKFAFLRHPHGTMRLDPSNGNSNCNGESAEKTRRAFLSILLTHRFHGGCSTQLYLSPLPFLTTSTHPPSHTSNNAFEILITPLGTHLLHLVVPRFFRSIFSSLTTTTRNLASVRN